MSVNAKLTAIANAIREKTGKTDKLSLDGMAEGVGETFDAGKKAGREEFWNAYLSDDAQKDSNSIFSGKTWRPSTFFPTRDIHPIGNAGSMFKEFGSALNGVQEEPLDFVKRLDDCGVSFDTSDATSCISMFNYANIKTLPTLNLANCSSYGQLLYKTPLVTVEKIIFSDVQTTTTAFNGTFSYAYDLEEVRFEGVINKKVNFQYCTKLSHDSLISVINVLADLAASGETATLTLGSENYAKLTADEVKIITDKGWDIA